jgi:hypothetical protein
MGNGVTILKKNRERQKERQKRNNERKTTGRK